MMHFLLMSIVFCSLAYGEIVPSESYTHSAELLDNEVFHVFWKFDNTTITFEVHAKTLGWVGFGLTPNGGMAGSDMTITWVKDGSMFFSDRHAVGKYQPVVDESQDWSLISAQESGQYTIIKVSRKHVTGDSQDLCITDGTSRLIYSFNPNDPSSESGPLDKHTVRGTKSVHLLSPPREEPNLPSDAFSVDFLNFEGKPSGDKDTTYWCQAMKPPQLNNTKHHVVMIEPIIEKGHEFLVHHMILYGCNFDLPAPYTPETADGFADDCYYSGDPAMDDLMTCQSLFFAWAIGGEKVWFPKHVGIPLGDDKYPTLFKLETHYDNPELQKNVVDRSGLRMWLSPTLRENDAAIMQIGVDPGPNQAVPPRSDAFLSKGLCHGECLAEGMKEVNIPNVKVFAGFLHSHLAGFGLRLRHIRDGVELPMILEDNSYDFNFQEMNIFNKEIPVQGGDHLLTECAYRTKDRTKLTQGGLSTRSEMCLSFLLYYPRIPVTKCESGQPVKEMAKFLEDEGMEIECQYLEKLPIGTCCCLPVLSAPPERKGQSMYAAVTELSWNETKRDRYQKTTTEGEIYLVCEATHQQKYKTDRRTMHFPEITKVYKDDSIYNTCPSAFKKFT